MEKVDKKGNEEIEDTNHMDIGSYNPKTSFNSYNPFITAGHFSLKELGLGKFTPLKFDVVAILDTFVFEHLKKWIEKKSQKKSYCKGFHIL